MGAPDFATIGPTLRLDGRDKPGRARPWWCGRPHPNGIKRQDVAAGAPPTGRPSMKSF